MLSVTLFLLNYFGVTISLQDIAVSEYYERRLHMQFTKDTSKVLTVIYKMYLERRKNGQSKSSAKNFDLEFYKGISCLSSWSEDDITDSLSELRKANFIKEYISGDFVLQDALIIHMENRFKNGLSEVSKYLADLIADIVTGLAF